MEIQALQSQSVELLIWLYRCSLLLHELHIYLCLIDGMSADWSFFFSFLAKLHKCTEVAKSSYSYCLNRDYHYTN